MFMQLLYKLKDLKCVSSLGILRFVILLHYIGDVTVPILIVVFLLSIMHYAHSTVTMAIQLLHKIL